MAKVYLVGADVETDFKREKARLLGIAHELYVQECEDKGTDYLAKVYGTMYSSDVKQIDGKWVLEIDDTSESYKKMINLHKAKIKNTLD